MHIEMRPVVPFFRHNIMFAYCFLTLCKTIDLQQMVSWRESEAKFDIYNDNTKVQILVHTHTHTHATVPERAVQDSSVTRKDKETKYIHIFIYCFKRQHSCDGTDCILRMCWVNVSSSNKQQANNQIRFTNHHCLTKNSIKRCTGKAEERSKKTTALYAARNVYMDESLMLRCITVFQGIQSIIICICKRKINNPK